MTFDEMEKLRIELAKIQYQKLADRYENIYKAVWQNFQYLALIAGAILTFGKDFEPFWVIIFLSGLPLLFWFWAQYIPMDRYGDDARVDLAAISKYFENVSGGQPIPGFNHYPDFAGHLSKEPGLFGTKWRVRSVLKYFATAMMVIWIVSIILTAFLARPEREKRVTKELAEIIVEGTQETQRLVIRAVSPPPASTSAAPPTLAAPPTSAMAPTSAMPPTSAPPTPTRTKP